MSENFIGVTQRVGIRVVYSAFAMSIATLVVPSALAQTEELHDAVVAGDEAMVEVLLDEGYDIVAEDDYGYSALEYAVLIDLIAGDARNTVSLAGGELTSAGVEPAEISYSNAIRGGLYILRILRDALIAEYGTAGIDNMISRVREWFEPIKERCEHFADIDLSNLERETIAEAIQECLDDDEIDQQEQEPE